MAFNLFGFQFGLTADGEQEQQLPTLVPKSDEGLVVLDRSDGLAFGDAYSTIATFDYDLDATTEADLIGRYREMSHVSEIRMALDQIMDEFVSTEENELVQIDLDQLGYSDDLKKKITKEFAYVINLLDFNNQAYQIIDRWYVDGRLNYQLIVDETKSAKQGIAKLVYIDPRQIKKVKIVKKEVDPKTKVELYREIEEFFMFSEQGFGPQQTTSTSNMQGVRLTRDSVAHITSGLMNSTNKYVLSYLHKAIRPLNLLKGLEDASIIYRLVRAPERRVFYIDTGNLPPAKAEQQLRRAAQQYKTKQVFDPNSGLMKSDSKQMTMMEDIWLPRNGNGKSTEIQTLPGGQNLGEMEEINYFLNKLFRALNVPLTRLDPQSNFTPGRIAEISRDEVTFMRFIERLRIQFAGLFKQLLRQQLALKNIMHPEEFDNISNLITFEFSTSNTFKESLENEILMGRIDLLDKISPYVGQYFSKTWVDRQILRLSEEEIEERDVEMEEDGSAEEVEQAKSDQAEIAKAAATPPPAPNFHGPVSIGQPDVSGISGDMSSNIPKSTLRSPVTQTKVSKKRINRPSEK